MGERCNRLNYDNILRSVLTDSFVKCQFLIHEGMFHTITGDEFLKNALETYHLKRLSNMNNLVYLTYW